LHKHAAKSTVYDAVLLQRNERVTYLNLSHNDFGHEGAIALGRAIGEYSTPIYRMTAS